MPFTSRYGPNAYTNKPPHYTGRLKWYDKWPETIMSEFEHYMEVMGAVSSRNSSGNVIRNVRFVDCEFAPGACDDINFIDCEFENCKFWE